MDFYFLINCSTSLYNGPLNTGDLNNGIIYDIPKKITNKALNETSVKLQPIGAVLIAMYGATIGKLGILAVSATTNQACCGCILYEGIFNKYLFYFLMANQRNFILQGAGGAQPNISREKIINTIIPIPALAEQHRIVTCVEKLLSQIDSLSKDEQKLYALQSTMPERLKASLLQAAIQGKLTERLPGDGNAEDLLTEIAAEKQRLIKEKKIKKEKPLPEIREEEKPFDLPEGWAWCRLGEITYNHGQKKPNIPFTYVDISSIDNKHQKLGNLSNIIQPDKAPSRARKIIRSGDVIYATVRPYLHNMCIIDRDIMPEPIVSTGFAVLCTPMKVLNQYLFYYLLSPQFDFYANSNENAKGVAYPAINDERLSKAIISLPPLAEQQRIVRRLEELLPLCEGILQNK